LSVSPLKVYSVRYFGTARPLCVVPVDEEACAAGQFGT